MDEQVPVIKTKIVVPGRRRELVHRSRLVDFIHEHIDRKLILISASAGYGKTSLLIDYAHDTDLPVCWYSLDEWDCDPRVFLEYLIASIKERFPRFGEKSQRALQGRIRADGMRSIVGTLTNEIREVIPDYFAVIIDDFHLISDGDDVTTLFGLLLRHLPENCHIILASRTTRLGLPVIELVAGQQLAGLGNDDLKFTPSEIRQLLKQNHNLDLPLDEAERLAQQSEGWITGILLTTHTLWKGLLRTMARAQGDDSQIFAYLAREVLEQQTEEVQRFLTGSSVLIRMNPSLCDGLLGTDNSRQMLSLVEDKNLFISRLEGDGGEWFRYHHLFQEFLRAKLGEEGDRYVSLNLRAGELFERQESWEEAIRHYLQAEAYERAATLVESVASWASKSGRWGSLLSWIDSLAAKVSLSPWIVYWQSTVFSDSGRLDEAVRALEEAREGFSKQGDRFGIANVLLEESNIHRLRAEYDEAIARAEEVLSILDDGQETAVIALARNTLGVCYGLQGQFAEGLAQLEEALRLFETLGEEREHEVANTLHDIGTIYYSVDIQKYLHYSRKALALWRRLDARGPLAMTLNNMGVALYRRGKFDEALKTLQEALAESQAAGVLRPQAYAQATMGDVYRAKGEYALAGQAYEQALERAERADEGFLVSYLWDALGNLQRILGDYKEAERLIGQALEKAYEHGSDYEVGVSLISQGILLHVQGKHGDALRVLRQTVASLQDLSVKQELAKAYFHLASVLFARRRVSDSILNVEIALDMLADVGFDPLLVDEESGSRPLLQYVLRERRLRQHSGLVRRLLSGTEPVGEAAVQIPESKPPRLELCALGPSRVHREGDPVEAQELRLGAREMLFFFLGRSVVTKQQIVAALWPELSLAKAHSTFHFYLFQVRRLLGGSGSIVYEGGMYRLDSRRYLYDVEEFQRALAKAEKAKGARRQRYLQDAIALYRGDYLEDIYSDWTAEPRTGLQRHYLGALEDLAEYYRQEARFEEAVEFYRKLLNRDPFREDIHRQVMRCLVQTGDRAGAIRQFEELGSILRDELGTDPSAETAELYEKLLAERV